MNDTITKNCLSSEKTSWTEWNEISDLTSECGFIGYYLGTA